jgi:ATP-dependent Lhr-like helicase
MTLLRDLIAFSSPAAPTWVGYRANATLAATLSEVTDPARQFDDTWIRLRENVTRDEWLAATAGAAERLCLPVVSEKAIEGLKFSSALPKQLAVTTLAARLADLTSAATVLGERSRFVVRSAD